MPIRIGDVLLFALVILVIGVCLGNRSRPKDQSSVSAAENIHTTALTVERARPLHARGQPHPQGTGVLQQTGRKANVAGIWGTFECVEYEFDNLLEVHVHQIDQNGSQLGPSRVHREPYEHVIDAYTNVTSW